MTPEKSASDAKELPGGLASAKDGDVFVYLDLTLSQELKEEGAVRELVRKIQDMRKRNGLGYMRIVCNGLRQPMWCLMDW